MPVNEPNVRLVSMSGRAADALAIRLGMVLRSRPVRLRASWIEFVTVPAFVRLFWGERDSTVQCPVIVDVNDAGLVFAHDPKGLLVWHPDDAVESAVDLNELASGWRQSFIPWNNIVSITADFDPSTDWLNTDEG
jgi:hypothetical protein